MDGSYQQIGELIARVRARWRRLLVLKAAVVAALTVPRSLLVALGRRAAGPAVAERARRDRRSRGWSS